MNFIESIKMAVNSLAINRLRSFLTMLGIIIGISSVITITTIGNSMTSTLEKSFDTLGASSITVYLQPKDSRDWDAEPESEDAITMKDINELTKAHPELTYSLSELFGAGEVINQNGDSFGATMIATTPNYFDQFKRQISKGRYISQTDCQQKRHTCFVSETFCRQYFKDPEDALGTTIRFTMKNSGEIVYLTIVGVMWNTELERNQLGLDREDILDVKTWLFMPYDTALELKGEDPENSDLGSPDIGWTSEIDHDTAKAYIEEYFNKKYENNEKWNVEFYDVQEDLGMINTVLAVVTVAISVIAAISLVVGGVGVMNIMLVSILERTREIGVRKAMGALESDIRRQFVIEAIIICLIGGLIGVAVGILNGFILGYVANMVLQSMASQYAEYITLSVRPSILAITISLGFSMLTGLIFGYYPAKRAGKMNPIDALRYE